MTVTPSVSIVVPLFNDEEFVSAALDSCLAQSLSDIEVICVDDASTDRTAAIVEEYQRRDPRVQLIRQPANLSAYQARRAGVAAAAAPYILFLDGDDELAPDAAKLAVAKATSTDADLVGFGVTIISEAGVPSRLQRALQPRFEKLLAPEIVPALFPAGEVANGHLWRYLFATPLLRAAYDGVPADETFYRVNDLPISFLAVTQARKYVSIPDRLYRYYFRRGTSGHAIDGVEHFRFLLGGIESISSIEARVRSISGDRAVRESYESARLHVIANVLRYCIRDTSGDLQRDCLNLLRDEVGSKDLVRAAASFCREALKALSLHAEEPTQPLSPVRSVLLTTSNLDTGGLQSVLLEHAALIAAAGYRVTVAVHRPVTTDVKLPYGVALVEVTGRSRLEQVDNWLAICHAHAVDMIIDHHILYNENWPWFVLAALSEGVPTIGWVHNFALRPLFDNSQRTSFLATHMRLLLRAITLSPTDVAFWKLQGLDRVAYIPNPPSPLTLAALTREGARERTGDRLELAWWGRLDRSTKQVLHLVDVAAHLRQQNVAFNLTIVGPDSRNLTARQVRERASAQGVDDAISLVGAQTPAELLHTLENVDLLVSTSAIEGFQLTIIEAQALGIPVVMYDLPWLTTVRGNAGVVTTAPGDPVALADEIARLANDPARYSTLSEASRANAESTAAIDVGALLVGLLTDDLPKAYAPEPTIEDARILTQWLVSISERNVRGRKRIEQDAEKFRGERDRARRELKHVKAGPSFRVGRFLTYLPRKLFGGQSNASTPATNSKQSSGSKKQSAAPTKATQQSPAARTEAAPPPPLKAITGVVKSRSTHPDVSIVIPVYNSAPWLDDCVSSVLAQTGVDVEVICINDGSTDNSREILQRYADADPRVTIVDQPNSGQSVGRNAGLAAATGRYVIYLDSDDYWPFDEMSTLVHRADQDELDVLLFDCFAFRDGEIAEKTWQRYATYYQRKYDYPGVRPGADIMAAMRRNKDYRPHVGMYMTRTAYVRSLGLEFIPGIVHQDNPYTFRLLLNTERVAYARLDVYARRMRPGSTITTLNADRSARGYYLSYIEMTRALDGRQFDPETETTIKNIVDGVYEGAQKQFSLISAETARELRDLDSAADAQEIYASLMTPPGSAEEPID